LETFFESHPKIAKGNILKLQNAIDNIFSQKPNLEKYKKLINFITKKYFKPKPVICECYFFPNPSNEQRVVNMFRTCKKTLDLAIFTFTRDSIAQAILEAHQRGVKIRCIGDDGNSKVKGSDVRLLASIGIPCKTDNNLRFHMHNKMAIIDNSVVITGSFNWTSQAVNKNQDNILFIEDKNIAGQYTEYYNKIWDSFNTVITQEEAKQYLANEKKAEEEKKAAKEQNTNPAPKKEINKKETTKKETTKKETAKKETTKKETTKKETTKKTSTSKGTKKATTTKKSESKPKEKKETTTKKSTSTTKKKETSTTKKKTTVKKETSKKSKSETKEKKKPATSKTKETKKTSAKTSKAKPKTVKEQKKEKNAKKKTEPKKRVRGVKTNKEKNTKKK
jgi:DNA polymerase III gamma/tau subunit